MSEPMSAVEIEDVLSSIRRLVSEELRPMKRTPRVGVGLDNKLLLTPALRVLPDVVGESQRDTGSVISRVADALAPSSDFEAETGDPEPQAVGMPQPWQKDDVGEDADMVVDAEAEDAQIEKLVFRSRQVTGESRGLVIDAETGPVLESPPPEVVERLMAEEAWAQQGAFDDNDTIPVPETLTQEAIADQVSDHAWADQAEAEVMANLSSDDSGLEALAAASEPEGDAGSETNNAASEFRFDENLLRELVRDLIREELQGTLGERITRNVRKLVRVEVARALALHDFE